MRVGPTVSPFPLRQCPISTIRRSTAWRRIHESTMSGLPAHPSVGRIAAVLAAAGARARAEGRPVLASVVERVTPSDPLAALDAVARASIADRALARHLEAGRFYWTRERDDVALAGIGAVATFTPEGADRMASVDRAWSALLEGALVDDPTVDGLRGATGRGPLLMGGFSFAPEGPRSETWRGFPGSHLIVPRFQLASARDECWLTVSAMVASDGVPDASAEEIVGLCRRILVSAASAPEVAWSESADPRLTFSSPMRAAEWRALVEDATTAIRAGRLLKVVLAREVHVAAPHDLDVIAVLRHLRAAQPDCFVFGYWRGGRAFVGASPERLVRLDGRAVQASSLAGSAARGASAHEDDALAAALLASEKDRAEHAAVREALRAGLADLCDQVVASETPSLLTLRHVHHLHTPVSAVLRRGHSLLDVVARLHPTPAVGGTPRAAALEFIRGHERLDRGWYAAPIGWVARDGGEFAVALRSAVIAGPDATLFAGCGIVAASDPDREFAESLVKLRPMQSALAAAVAPVPLDATPVAAAAEREP